MRRAVIFVLVRHTAAAHASYGTVSPRPRQTSDEVHHERGHEQYASGFHDLLADGFTTALVLFHAPNGTPGVKGCGVSAVAIEMPVLVRVTCPLGHRLPVSLWPGSGGTLWCRSCKREWERAPRTSDLWSAAAYELTKACFPK